MNKTKIAYSVRVVDMMTRIMREKGRKVTRTIPYVPVDSKQAFDLLEDYEERDDDQDR